VTTFDTPDNVRTFVGNNKIFFRHDSKLHDESVPPRGIDGADLRRADPALAISRLKDRIGKIANVLDKPAPDVTIVSFTPFGPVLAVRPYCHNDNYWQVYFDANMAIREVLGDSAFPGAAYQVMMQQRAASA
jgi:small conductance mechanosensitive channel